MEIGGPCMLRASAKNFLRVAGVCDTADYSTSFPIHLRRTGRTVVSENAPQAGPQGVRNHNRATTRPSRIFLASRARGELARSTKWLRRVTAGLAGNGRPVLVYSGHGNEIPLRTRTGGSPRIPFRPAWK